MKKIVIILTIIALIISCDNGIIGLGEKIDIDSPEITVGQYADGSPISNADYVRGIIILSGTVTDDVGVSAVNLTIVDTVTSSAVTGSAEIDYASMTWSYSVDTTSFIDGEKDITIEVLDTSSTPKTDSVQRLLFFDNTAPLVIVQSLEGYGSASSDADIGISGDAYDPFRIKSVQISLITGSGSVDSISPTSGPWSSVLRSSGTGNYEMTIVATDYAGNVSEGIYHIADVQTANDNAFISVKDIYDIREGSLVQGSGLQQAHLESGALLLTELPLSIDLSADEPQVTISNPDPNALPSENVLAANAKAIGSITDDDGIDVSTVEININSTGWIPVDNTIGSGLFVKWDHDLSAVGGGDHTLQVRADDIYGVSKETAIVNFSINLGAPDIVITDPTIGDYLDSGTFTITGTAEDTTGGVNFMQISLDDGANWGDLTDFVSGTSIAWSHDVSGQPDGVMLIKIKASDTGVGNNWSYNNLQVIVDTEYPTNTILYPGNNSFVNGLVEVRGASSDNNQLAQVEVRIGDADPWIVIPEEERYNWTLSFNSLDYENSSDSAETSAGSCVWNLNIYTRITDIAGNVAETNAGDHVIKIDNSLDRPTVNIISPYNDQSIGGAVLISGTSFDDDGPVYGVYMQIDVNTPDGGTPDFLDSVTLSDPIDFDGTGPNAPVTTIDESAWYLLNGKNPWTVEMNGNGELYSTEAGHTGDLHIRIKAIDKDGGVDSISGEYEELHIKMDDTVPYFSDILPVSDEYVNGSFTLTGNVFDDTSIQNLEISYNGGAQYHDIIRNGIIDAAYGGGTVTNTYVMNIPIDTSTVPDVGSITSDTLSMRLKVTDDTYYQTLQSLRYYVDNTLPEGNSSDFDDINGSASSAVISGTATDTGTVNGISHVEAYLVRDISGTKYFYNPRSNDDTIVASTMNINGTVHEYPNGAGYDNYLITIDSTSETLGGANSDGDGIAEELNVGIEYEWKYMFDSENIPDGSIELHYVVVDNAGNMNHYENTGFIRNHAPVIESITLGTDLNGINGIEGSEEAVYLPASFSGTDFTGRNDSLKLIINLEAGTGNAPLSYSVTYLGGGNLITSGSEALIDTSGFAEVNSNGAEFICTVTDNAGLVTTESISLNIDNVDEVSPTIEFDALDADTSVPENGGVKEGHIEERGWTKHDNGIDNPGDVGNDVSDDDPDISGKIIFNGSAWDDQRIQKIVLWIDMDGDGALEPGEATTVADEDTDGTLKSADAGFTIITETLTEISGHNVAFKYEWDSSTLTNVAGDNIQVKLVAEDYNSIPNSNAEQPYPGSGYNLMTVDVVPYITGILRNPINYNTNRSRYGRFPLKRGETLSLVNGFNLRTGGGSDEFGVDLLKTGSIDTPIVPTGSTGTDQLEFTVPAGLTSGWLRVIVNGVEAINNLNDNSRIYNQEYSAFISGSDYWSDDRYILAFNAGNAVADYFSDAGGDPQFAAMDVASDGTLYASWSTYSTSDVSYSQLNGGAIVDVWHGYDPPEFTDISVSGTDVNVLYLANYHGGSAANWTNDEDDAGGLYLYDPTGYTFNSGRAPDDEAFRFELMYHDETLLQFRNIRVTRAELGVNDRIHISYYDNDTSSIKYSNVQENFDPGTANHEIPWINIDGGSDSHDTADGTGLANQYDASLTRAASTGVYSSVVLDEDNYPLVVYYDGENQTMRLARSNNENPSALANWTIQEVFNPGDSNYNFTGEYISAQVDGDGYLHIVSYKSSQGKVVYIKSTNNPESGAAYTFGTSVELDTSSGVWADIHINDEGGTYRPYIAYLDSTGINSFDGLKLAYWDESVDNDFDDVADGGWETANVPLMQAIKNERISLVTTGQTGSAWTAAMGYKSGSHFYVAYLY